MPWTNTLCPPIRIQRKIKLRKYPCMTTHEIYFTLSHDNKYIWIGTFIFIFVICFEVIHTLRGQQGGRWVTKWPWLTARGRGGYPKWPRGHMDHRYFAMSDQKKIVKISIFKTWKREIKIFLIGGGPESTTWFLEGSSPNDHVWPRRREGGLNFLKSDHATWYMNDPFVISVMEQPPGA